MELNGVYGGMNVPTICRIALTFGVLGLGLANVTGRAQESASATASAESLAVGNKMYDREKELARLTKRYGLTDDQKQKIAAILLEQQRQVHELGEDQSLSNSAWASAVWKVHLQTVAQVKLQMTDAQASKYATDEAKRKKSNASDDAGDDGPPDGFPPGPPPGGGPPGP
jgi:hypothetical protein